jgi:hypothetical protein
MKRRVLAGLWLALNAGWTLADEIALASPHPQTYVVAPGDTLWNIAGKFLEYPWQWPAIWRENPHIRDPHWIYPGDELTLSLVDGQPQVQVTQRPDEERLSPRIRIDPLARATPAIPLSAIQQFLVQPKVVEAGELQRAPHVFAIADEHLIGGAGDRVYVRGLKDDQARRYMLFRPGKTYADALTGEILGYEALYVADAELQAFGDVSTLFLTASDREALIGDRLLPIEADTVTMRYELRPPPRPVRGHIIDVVDGLSQIGQYQVVLIDRGAADGLETGHALQVSQSGRIQRDNVALSGGENVRLPDEKAGIAMVFKAFDRISYALVLKATRAIHLNDAASSP